MLVDVYLGAGTVVAPFTNLYGCSIGDGTRIGPFVEIQRGVSVGARCKIQSHTFVCEGVTIEDEVFVGHGVLFVNDKTPRSTTNDGDLQKPEDWTLLETVVERGASLGSGCIVLGGVRVGAGALVGAGAVVSKDVPAGSVVVERGVLSLTNMTPCPTNTSSSIVTPSQMNEWLWILQRAPTVTPRWISTNGPIRVPSPIEHP